MSEFNTEHSVQKVGFKWDISFGNVLSIATITLGLVGGYIATVSRVDAAYVVAQRMPAIEQSISDLQRANALMQQSLETGRTARVQFQDQMLIALRSIEQDRKEQQSVNTEVLQKLAGIIARLDEREK